jgi:hypothetical protein
MLSEEEKDGRMLTVSSRLFDVLVGTPTPNNGETLLPPPHHHSYRPK